MVLHFLWQCSFLTKGPSTFVEPTVSSRAGGRCDSWPEQHGQCFLWRQRSSRIAGSHLIRLGVLTLGFLSCDTHNPFPGYSTWPVGLGEQETCQEHGTLCLWWHEWWHPLSVTQKSCVISWDPRTLQASRVGWRHLSCFCQLWAVSVLPTPWIWLNLWNPVWWTSTGPLYFSRPQLIQRTISLCTQFFNRPTRKAFYIVSALVMLKPTHVNTKGCWETKTHTFKSVFHPGRIVCVRPSRITTMPPKESSILPILRGIYIFY